MNKVYVVMQSYSTWEGNWDNIESVHKDYSGASREAELLNIKNDDSSASYYVQSWEVQ